MEDFDIIMIYQTITVCSSLLHDKIPWLRFENESDSWYYSLLFWNILSHAILKIWLRVILWYLNLPLFRVKDLMAPITEFARENYCATIMIILYGDDTLIFDTHIMMKMISRYYHFIITQISIKYQNINSQTNNILSKYFDKQQYCT